jgi:hypothetical protein
MYLTATREAMAAENITGSCQERVVNRLLYGHPGGFRHEPGRDETQVMFSGSGMAPRDGGGGAPSAPAYENPLHPFPVEPAPDAPVFGKDFREVNPAFMDSEPVHPLLSGCRCGGQILRQVPGDSWEHC